MSIYEILPALDLTQSIHAKISIGMHRGVKFKISRIPLIGILDISVPGHFGTRYWTVRDLDETIFGTDHICLVLINCQYFCTSSSLIYDPKVDRYVFLIIPV
jgi:hypothetical protein